MWKSNAPGMDVQCDGHVYKIWPRLFCWLFDTDNLTEQTILKSFK